MDARVVTIPRHSEQVVCIIRSFGTLFRYHRMGSFYIGASFLLLIQPWAVVGERWSPPELRLELVALVEPVEFVAGL
jgi:hypothetical protein